MPTPATITDFLTLVQHSQLLEDQSLDGYLDQLRQGGAVPGTPVALAGLLVRDGLLTAFQAEQLLQGRSRGFLLGKYRILEKLGAGGMGTVYRALHRAMGRAVALKVLPPNRAADPECLGRFYREAQAVAALNHPNIVRAYDVDREGDVYFLVMEYVDGINLQDLVQRHGPLAAGRAAEYVRQAACGLMHAHENGLVHRDVKPANLLVNRAGLIKVLDLGLARFFHTDDGLTREHAATTVLGTADYLAPEQGLDSHDVDIRADLYSLGATFYFLLVGRAPFADGTLNQKLIWHQTRVPPPVRSLRPEVPAGLEAVVARLLAKNPDARYPTPQALADALAPWTVNGVPPPSPEELPPLRPVFRPGGGGSSTAHAATGVRGPITTFPELELPPPSPSTTPLPAGPGTKRPSGTVRAAELLAVAPAASPATPGATPATHHSPLTRRRPASRRRLLWAAAGTAALLLATTVGLAVALRDRQPPAPPPAPPRPAPASAVATTLELRAAAGDRGLAELNWGGRPGRECAFTVERSTDRNFAADVVALGSTPAGHTHYTDRTAPAGQTFFYRVRNPEGHCSNIAWLPPNYGKGFTGHGLVLNGGAAVVRSALRLTDHGQDQARSAFYHLPVDVRGFTTSFRFKIQGGRDTADGFTFCIQNAGSDRVGVKAGGLGYQGLDKSVAVKFDLWNNAGEGNNSTGLFLRGEPPLARGSLNLRGSGIDLHNGRVYQATLTAKGSSLGLTITDVGLPRRAFRHTFEIDVPYVVGGPTAYVGFTGGTGGKGAVQEIQTWTWAPATEPPPATKPKR